MNLSKFFVKKSLFGPKIFKVQNNFGLNRILGQKNFRSSKIVDPIIFSCKKKMIQKNLRPNKKLSPKNIGTKNLFVQKKSKMFESNIIVVQKNLGPENLLPSKIGYSNA